MRLLWLIAALLFVSHPAHAQEAPELPEVNQAGPGNWQFYPNIGIGWNRLKFDRPGGLLEADYKTLNVGLTVTYKKLFFSLDGELFGKSNFQNDTDFTSLEREDQTLTIGGVIGQFTVFGGYTEAETKDDFLGEFHFDEGPFIGAGYDFPIGQSALGLSLAYADLDGEIFEDEVGLIESGKTRGLSYRIGFSGPLHKNLGYKVFVRYRSYDFESDDSKTDKDILSIAASVIF